MQCAIVSKGLCTVRVTLCHAMRAYAISWPPCLGKVILLVYWSLILQAWLAIFGSCKGQKPQGRPEIRPPILSGPWFDANDCWYLSFLYFWGCWKNCSYDLFSSCCCCSCRGNSLAATIFETGTASSLLMMIFIIIFCCCFLQKLVVDVEWIGMADASRSTHIEN